MDFATAEQGSTEEMLADFVRRFPEHEQALRHLFATLGEEEATEWTEIVPQPAQTTSLEQRVRALGLFDQIASSASEKAPFEGRSPQELRQLAKDLNLSTVFFAKLKDRVIDVQTMSDVFLCWLAAPMGATIQSLRDYFSAEPRMAKGLAFKADGKPQTKAKQSFEEALESSGLSDEQKRMLKELN